MAPPGRSLRSLTARPTLRCGPVVVQVRGGGGETCGFAASLRRARQRRPGASDFKS